MRRAIFFLMILAVLGCGISIARAADDVWTPVGFLVGNWKGGGNAEGQPGAGTTKFAFDLGHQVLVRRDRSDYPATPGHPAQTYEAMMVIYPDAMTKHLRADYFDDGGHVIHYTLATPGKANEAQFLSDAGPGPAFRLTYDLQKESLAIKFEMQPPGAATYQTIAIGAAEKQP